MRCLPRPIVRRVRDFFDFFAFSQDAAGSFCGGDDVMLSNDVTEFRCRPPDVIVLV